MMGVMYKPLDNIEDHLAQVATGCESPEPVTGGYG